MKRELDPYTLRHIASRLRFSAVAAGLASLGHKGGSWQHAFFAGEKTCLELWSKVLTAEAAKRRKPTPATPRKSAPKPERDWLIDSQFPKATPLFAAKKAKRG